MYHIACPIIVASIHRKSLATPILVDCIASENDGDKLDIRIYGCLRNKNFYLTFP